MTEETSSNKKEIVVKRLSAFKFSVEVSQKEMQVGRVSVIQRAPPATTPPEKSPDEQFSRKEPGDTVPILQAINQRVIEILLKKLIGEEELRRHCGYPNVNPCQLLFNVVILSGCVKNEQEKLPCINNFSCFMNHVEHFLGICAPTESHWTRFGWSQLSTQDILFKIYKEELLPNFNESKEHRRDLLVAYNDVDMLLQWAKQGITSVISAGSANETEDGISAETTTQSPLITQEKKRKVNRPTQWPYFHPMDVRVPPHRPLCLSQHRQITPRLKGMVYHRPFLKSPEKSNISS